MVNLGVTGTVRRWAYQINGQKASHTFSSMQNALEAAHIDFKRQCEELDELDSAHVKCMLIPNPGGETQTVWLEYKKGGDCLECGHPFKDNSKWWPCCSRKCAAEHYN